MSAQSIAGIPEGELLIAQRVAQLQSLISQASGGSPATLSTAQAEGSGAFSQALEQAGAGAYAPLATAASTQSGASQQSGQYEELIQQAAERNGIEPALLHGLIQQESGFNPSAASSAGAQGLTQLMPGTASAMGVSNPLNPAESIEGGARYLGGLMSRFAGNASDALAAYNAGPGAVEQYGGIPPYGETQSYVSSVLGYAEQWRQAHPQTQAMLS